MDPNIFRKFSENLKKILVLAEKIANDSGRPLESQDILLAITITQGTLANDILLSMDITTERVQIVAKLVSSEMKKQSDRISAEVSKIIQKTVQIAAKFNHQTVDVEHLLLALVSDTKSNASNIIERIGGNPNKIKEQIETIFHEISKATGDTADMLGVEFDRLDGGMMNDDFLDQQPFGRVATKDSGKTLIDQFTINLTNLAKEKKLDPLVGRESEITRATQILSRRTKNNPLLIGEPGVGKTAIVEGLAKKISEGNVPPILIGKSILSLDLGSLLAGTMYRGQFESRVKKLLAEIKKLGNVILFIDEIHTTIGTGSAEGSLDTANLLKPILSRGEFKLIGATTFDEYKKHIEKDPAYERRFQVVQVNEPTVAETYKILLGLRSRYEKHHKIKFSNDALLAASELSNQYISDRFLPDKAIDLIDEAAAATNIISPSGNKIASLKSRLLEIKNQKDDAVAGENYEAATHLREDEIKIVDQIHILEEETNKTKKQLVDKNDIANVVARWTGIPVQELSFDQRKGFLNLESKLKKHVIGQNEAVKIISQSIRRNRAGISDPHRPIGSFLFLGPTGVGKTHLSKTLAAEIFGSAENLIKIDMSEFMERHNVSRLVGAPAGYVGYEDGGKLTEAVRRKPYSIILFDEIEKAHPEFFNILLQIFEDGYLTDAKGRRVNFRNTIIILTSNLGTSELNKNAAIGFQAENSNQKADATDKYNRLKENIIKTVKKELRPEFVNRLDNIIIFKPLDFVSVEKIVDLNIAELARRLRKQKISLQISPEVKKYLATSGYSEEFGARPIRRLISEKIEDPISEEILSGHYQKNDVIQANLIDSQIVFRK